MGNFRINNPDQEAYYEPVEVKHFWVAPGTSFMLQRVGDAFKTIRRIEVTYC